MNNYREQSGCHNCQHAFTYKEYDEGSRLYCALNAPPRPRCGSVFMGECGEEHDSIGLIMEEWDAWSEGREVKPYGICDSYSHETQDQQA